MTSKPKTQVFPLVDILESDADFLLVADLPGVTREQLDVQIERGELRLRAETEDVEFRRTFELGEDVDVEAISAKLDNGTLELRLPKNPAKRVRKIDIG